MEILSIKLNDFFDIYDYSFIYSIYLSKRDKKLVCVNSYYNMKYIKKVGFFLGFYVFEFKKPLQVSETLKKTNKDFYDKLFLYPNKFNKLKYTNGYDDILRFVSEINFLSYNFR